MLKTNRNLETVLNFHTRQSIYIISQYSVIFQYATVLAPVWNLHTRVWNWHTPVCNRHTL
jgi:hypothetical protein